MTIEMKQIPDELVKIDPKTSIWRYYRFDYFLRLLEYKSIYIPVASAFEDEFEGFFPTDDEKRMKKSYLKPFVKK